MKVKNNIKGVLVVKSVMGETISLKPSATHTFKKEELTLYTKNVSAYIKSGWLVEVKKSEKAAPEAPKVDAPEAPKEAPQAEAPVEAIGFGDEEVAVKKVTKKKVAKKAKKVAKKTTKRTRK